MFSLVGKLSKSVMLNKLQENTITIVAQFKDPVRADNARSTIEGMLVSAQVEADALFERQGGVADATDLAEIYARFGFRNDTGWRHERPVVAIGEEIFWELPEGLVLEEAHILLLALGAKAIAVQTEDEQWRQSLHPLAYVGWDEERDFYDADDEELPYIGAPAKKTLH